MRTLAIVLALCLAACAAPAAQNGSAPRADASKTGIPHGETGGMCGGFAGFQCLNESNYCKMEVGVCGSVADAAGTCELKPQICTMDYRPVCGCDGKTYGNACAAAGAGVSIASQGECDEAAK